MSNYFRVLDKDQNYTGEIIDWKTGEVIAVENESVITLIDDRDKPYSITAEQFDELFFTCDVCGYIYEIEDLNEDASSDTHSNVCQSCVDEGDYVFYCEGHCKYEIDSEGDQNVWVRDYSGDYGLRCCYEYAYDNYFSCTHCDELYDSSDCGRYDRNEDWYCQSCIDNGWGEFSNEDSDFDGILNDYHSYLDSERKSEFTDRLERETNLHMGFELEVHNDYGVTQDAMNDVNDMLGSFCVFEHDCSIEPGFEIISQPSTLEYYLERESDFESIFNTLVNSGYVSHKGGLCGLHVHIDRDFFDNQSRELVEAKFLYIFYKWWDKMAKFSRRRKFTYCGKSNLAGESIAKVVKDYGNKRYWVCGHSVALNIENEDTIEIRLWRGTLKLSTFIATLKFSQRLADVVKTHSVCELAKMSWEDILGNDEDIINYWNEVKDR